MDIRLGKNFGFHKFFSGDACAGVGMGVERGGRKPLRRQVYVSRPSIHIFFVFGGYVYELELPSRDPAFDSDVLFELAESRATVALEEPIVARNL